MTGSPLHIVNLKIVSLLGVALVSCAALFALTSLPARAQIMPGFQLGAEPELSPEEKERNAANAKAAREARSKIIAPKASNDPWADVRSNDAPARSAKPKSGAR